MIPILPFGGGGDYAIARSLRTRGSANAGLYRSVATTTNRRTFTLSRWFKLGAVGSGFMLWQSFASASDWASIYVHPSGSLGIAQGNGGVGYFTASTTALFRDPTAWYHLVVQVDTTDATASNRLRAWINGTPVTITGSGPGLPTLNAETHFNRAGYMQGFGYEAITGWAHPTDGLHAELHFVDGQLVAPAAFGKIDPSTGAWVSIRYEGGYGGANGAFHDFRDATSVATLGYDQSGKGNHLTPSGISAATSVNGDSFRDTPTNNHAALNPLDKDRAHGTASNANLTVTAESYVDNYAPIRATIAVDSGKWYFEATADKASTHGNALAVGWGDVKSDLTGAGAPSSGVYANWNRSDVNASFAGGAYSTTANYGDVVMIAIDIDAGKFWAGRNGVWLNAGNPAAGTGHCTTFTASSLFAPFVSPSKGSSPTYSAYQSKADVNFGQRDFAYAPPSGFVALCAENSPAPLVKRPVDHVDALNYDGNGGAQSILSLRFSPDFVRIKCRSKSSTSHATFDGIRGARKFLYMESSGAEQDFTSQDYGVTAFGANGFSVADDTNGSKNVNGVLSGTWGGNYNAWAMKRGALSGFDIVAYGGNGTNRTIAHALGAIPHFMIGKRRDGSASWTVYHRNMSSNPEQGFLLLNSAGAYGTLSSIWNNTAPTNSIFALGTDTNLNASGSSNVMYLWTEIPGFSRFGGYAGTGSSDGTFVWCGFKPRLVLIKNVTGATSWMIYDAARNAFNATDLRLAPDATAAEASSGAIDFTANGFKLRANDANTNGGATSYIFAAFAETPFKYATAR